MPRLRSPALTPGIGGYRSSPASACKIDLLAGCAYGLQSSEGKRTAGFLFAYGIGSGTLWVPGGWGDMDRDPLYRFAVVVLILAGVLILAIVILAGWRLLTP